MPRKHDESYKLLFSQPVAVEELVRGFLGEELAAGLDFETLEPMPAEHLSEGMARRQGDLLWKVRHRGSWLYVLLLLEFQSETDYFMALRILIYTCLTYEELVRRGEVKRGEKFPPVLPVTIYNGRARWRVPTDISELVRPAPRGSRRFLPKSGYLLVDMQRLSGQGATAPNVVTSLARMEADPSPENLERVMRELVTRFRGPNYRELRKALRSWVAGAAEAWQIPEGELARIQSWTEEGRMYERIREMREQVRRDGVEEGLARGLERGRAEERAALLGRLATRKFGAETAAELSRILEGVADPNRIAEVADAIIDCDSGKELFARVGWS